MPTDEIKVLQKDIQDLKLIVETHRALMPLKPENVEKFKDVVEMEEEGERVWTVALGIDIAEYQVGCVLGVASNSQLQKD